MTERNQRVAKSIACPRCLSESASQKCGRSLLHILPACLCFWMRRSLRFRGSCHLSWSGRGIVRRKVHSCWLSRFHHWWVFSRSSCWSLQIQSHLRTRMLGLVLLQAVPSCLLKVRSCRRRSLRVHSMRVWGLCLHRYWTFRWMRFSSAMPKRKLWPRRLPETFEDFARSVVLHVPCWCCHLRIRWPRAVCFEPCSLRLFCPSRTIFRCT